VPSNSTLRGERRLRIAVVPEQLPRAEDDFAGIFTLDYIEAIRGHCDVVVVRVGDEDRAGVRRERVDDGLEYVTCVPAIRGGGHRRQRLGRIESLYRTSRTAGLLEDIDLIHAHGAVFNGVPALTLGSRLGVPVVLTIHTGPFSKLIQRRLTRLLTCRTLERVDCVCSVSKDLERQIKDSGIRARRSEVTYNPVNTALFRLARPRAQREPRILFAGRLEEYKGGLRTARAFASIADRLPDWKLTVAGVGPEFQSIRALATDNPALRGRIQLVGTFTRPQLAELLRESDFFVYPSRHETFGLVLAEAMSAGLPVVAPNRTAPPEFVDERSGVLVEPDDIRSIGAAIQHVATNLKAFDNEAIRARVVERFGLFTFGDRLVEIYRSLVCPPLRAETTTCAD
jgi:glycosyltransferase involved in cell wall biosynthesis